MNDDKEATCRYALVSTAPGWVGILASPRGIRRLTLPQASPAKAYAYLELSELDVSTEPAPEAIPKQGFGMVLPPIPGVGGPYSKSPKGLLEYFPGMPLDIERRLERYFLGQETAFHDVLDVTGTPFQKRAWEVVRTIPWGETRSYTWVAHNTGRPGAARAVGQAMRANPVPFIVPCHRVIGRDGSLCGYGGPEGVDLKRKL